MTWIQNGLDSSRVSLFDLRLAAYLIRTEEMEPAMLHAILNISKPVNENRLKREPYLGLIIAKAAEDDP